MQTGSLNERIKVYKFENMLSKENKKIWGKATEKNARCVFCQNGVSALKTMTFTVYGGNKINETNILELKNRKYLPVSIIPNKNPVYVDIVCAPVNIKTMLIYKNVNETDENRLVISTKREEKEIQVIFASKYVSLTSNSVFNTENRSYVVVIPKNTDIDSGTVVKIDNVFYYVTACLENGEFFNEYQLEIKEDA